MLHLLARAELEKRGVKRTSVPPDFEEWAATCRIRSQSKFVPFRLFPYQKKLAELIDQYERVEIFKSRQVGATELIIASTAHQALLDPGFSALIFSIGQNESTELAKRIKQMPQSIEWEKENTRELKPVGGGTLYFRPSTSSAGRSFPSVTRVILDEAGFVRNAQELIAAAAPSQEMGGDATSSVIISTMPESGAMSWFWQSFQSGQSRLELESRIDLSRQTGFEWWECGNGTCKVLIHRRANPYLDCEPGYLERLVRERGITLDQGIREYDLGMPRGDGSLFLPEFIEKAAIGQWCPPVPGRTYLAGVDPNFGGADYFALTIWDVTANPVSLVAQYHESSQTIDRAMAAIVDLLQRYRPIITAVEKNSGGQIILERLTSLMPYLQFQPVVTTRGSKRQNTDRIAIALEQGELTFPPDWAGIEELHNFSAVQREAMMGHDDLVMSTSIAFAWLHAAYPRVTSLGRCIAY